mmetsp:Transcript_88262/g.258002  ORF Transcript_88262/g.258002 Transcript_88262/m.258002 type:complete len:546 (-) Transcript_88262:103-1740(-)
MAFCSACLMLALLAPGGTAADAGLDMSAMVQVVADVTVGDALHAQYDFDSDSEFDAAATEELVFKGVLGTPSELTGSQDFGGKDALTRASKALSKAWIDDARQLLSETANLALTQQETFLADLEPHSDGTEAFEEISEYVKTGKMDWQDLNWIQKMSESHAAMTAKMMDKNMDWQKLASDVSLLQTQTNTSDPEGDVTKMRKHLDTAVEIAVNKGLEDVLVLSNMTRSLGKAWKDIATKSLMDAAGKQLKRLNKMVKKGPLKRINHLVQTTTGGKVQAVADVDGAIKQWLDEYIKQGKISYAGLDVVRKMTERSAQFAAQWVDRGVNFARDAIGSFLALGTQALDEEEEHFGPVKVFSEAPVEIDEDVAGNVAEIVQRHMREMSQRQDELAAAGAQPYGMPEQVSDSFLRGDSHPEMLVNLKATTEASADLARRWVENTADLQKLISGVFMVMSQQTSPAARTVVDDVKRDFESVMLRQEQLVGKRPSSNGEQEPLLPENRLKLESLQRVKTIADDSLEMARQWFEENQLNRQMTSAVLAQLTKQ